MNLQTNSRYVSITSVQMNPLDRHSEELGRILSGQFHYNVKFVASINITRRLNPRDRSLAGKPTSSTGNDK